MKLLYSCLILLICLTTAFTQVPIPSSCASVLVFQGSSAPYAGTDSAAPFQTLCSVKEQMSQCIEDNKEALLASTNPVDWAIGITFVKSAFDEKLRDACATLPSVASDLECLKTNQGATCGNILPDNSAVIFEILTQYRGGNIPELTAVEAVCGIMSSSADCWESQLSGCSQAAIDFMVAYDGIYSANCPSELPPEIADSVFVVCGIGSFPEVIIGFSQLATANLSNISPDFITNLTLSIADSVCSKSDEFSDCLVERLHNSTNGIDQLIMQFVNASNVKETLKMACDSESDLKSSTDCLSDLAVQIPYCAEVYLNITSDNVTEETTIDVANIGSYKTTYCPVLNDVVDCMSIPLSRCNQGLSTKINSLVDLALTGSCRGLSDQGHSGLDLNIGASVFAQCGVGFFAPMAGYISELFVEGGLSNITEVGQKIMDNVCSNSDWFFSCVDQRLSMSSNVLDRFITEIIDYSGSVNHRQIVQDVCNNRREDILQNFGCLLSKFVTTEGIPSLLSCNGLDTSVFDLFQNTAEIAKMDGNTVRSTFCQPIDNILSCGKDELGSCSSKLEDLFDKVPRSLLRTDCGGIRQTATTTRGNRVSTTTPSDKVSTTTLSNRVVTAGLSSAANSVQTENMLTLFYALFILFSCIYKRL